MFRDRFHTQAKARGVIATALLAPLLVVILPASAPGTQTDQTDALPDLRIRRITSFYIEWTTDDRKLLRFPTVIVNAGSGRFDVRGHRPSTNVSTMTTRQRIYDRQGGHRSVASDAVMYFAGDGHNHWHVRDLNRYSLYRVGGGPRVGTGAKHGFCFYDNTTYNLALPGAPSSPYYKGCGDSDNLGVMMGLSVGWGDTYSASLRDQYIDVTDLPDGDYRLAAEADASNWFLESDKSNNKAVTVIRIAGSNVTVLRVKSGA